jgi:hypothetical protein
MRYPRRCDGEIGFSIFQFVIGAILTLDLPIALKSPVAVGHRLVLGQGGSRADSELPSGFVSGRPRPALLRL